jgi:four helix bundle protein
MYCEVWVTACVPSTKFLHFWHTARDSLMELDTHVEIARRLNYLNAAQAGAVSTAIADIGRMMAGLRRSLVTRLRESPADS